MSFPPQNFFPMTPPTPQTLHYYSVLGRALIVAQHFEMDCRGVLGFFYLYQHPGELVNGLSDIVASSPSVEKDIDLLLRHLERVDEFQEFVNKFDKISKWTLGQYAAELKKMKFVGEQFEVSLKQAVEARNYLIHSSYCDLEHIDEKEIKEVMDALISATRVIAKTDKYFSAMLAIFNRDPLPNERFFDEFDDRVIAWVQSPTFRNGLT